MTWLKYGCFGCLGVIGVLVLAGAVLWGLAWQRSQSMEVGDQVLTRELPAEWGRQEGGVSPEDLEAELPESSAGAPPVAAGRVVLNLSAAEFRIEPGRPGEPLRVEGTFDRKGYTLEERFEQGEAGAWQYDVSFRRTGGSGLVTTLSEMISGSRPKVTVFLPPDRRLALEMNLDRGGVTAELGGLWLTDAAIKFSMGGLDLAVSEPLREPMGRLIIDGHMGGGNLGDLGNASPRVLEVEYRMGGVNLDLTGAWRGDAEIIIDTSMSGASVQVPRGVRLEGLPPEAKVTASDDPAAPKLIFTLSTGSGELEFYQ